MGRKQIFDMKKTLLLLMLLTLVGNSRAMGDSLDDVAKSADFIGSYGQFVKENLVYPYQAANNGVTGIVTVWFVINTDGSVSNVTVHNTEFHTKTLMRKKAVESYGKALSDEAVRITKLTSGHWNPARDEQDNKIVSRFEISFTFRLD